MYPRVLRRVVFVLVVFCVTSLGVVVNSSSSKSSGSGEKWETGQLTFVDVDLTLQIASAGADVVDAALDTIDLTCIFDDDKLLLRRMAAALTNDGLDEETFLGGAEGGIWNISEALFSLTQTSPALAAHRTAVKNYLGIDWSTVQYADLTKPLFSALAAKLFLQSISATIPRTLAGQAKLVAEEILPGSPELESEFVANLNDREDGTCSSASMDVVLILDGSGSVTSESFDKVRNFARRFLDAVDLGSEYTRVAVIKYSSSVQVEFYLNEFYDKQKAKDAVSDIRYLEGSTNTAAALRVAAETMFSTVRGARGDNSGVPKVAIVLTDGQSNNPGATEHAAQQLRETGVAVFAVGIGPDVDVSELNAIASNPDCSHVFELTGFDEVIDFVEQIKQSACKEPAQLELGSDIISTLLAGQQRYSTFVAKVNEGIKIDLATHMGEVRLYLSAKTKNPNSASHQWRCRGNMNERGRCFIPPGQLRKLVREGRDVIQMYATYAADPSELARFSAIIDSGGNNVSSSGLLMTSLVILVALVFRP